MELLAHVWKRNAVSVIPHILSVRESKKETENQDLLQCLASIQRICTEEI